MNWQPIETAPKDGTRILGWTGEEIVTLDYEQPHCYPAHVWHEGYWYQESESGRATTFYPTHWMPLPPPPTEQTSDSNRPHPEIGAVPKSET